MGILESTKLFDITYTLFNFSYVQVVGVPLIVFFGILSLYLSAQLELYLVASALMGSVVTVFLLSLSTWFTVHSCYSMFYKRQEYYGYEAGGDVQLTQPLISNGGAGAQGERSRHQVYS